ncbi:hypothetical protein SK128_025010, partial [Halocaridina rubra]
MGIEKKCHNNNVIADSPPERSPQSSSSPTTSPSTPKNLQQRRVSSTVAVGGINREGPRIRTAKAPTAASASKGYLENTKSAATYHGRRVSSIKTTGKDVVSPDNKINSLSNNHLSEQTQISSPLGKTLKNRYRKNSLTPSSTSQFKTAKMSENNAGSAATSSPVRSEKIIMKTNMPKEGNILNISPDKRRFNVNTSTAAVRGPTREVVNTANADAKKNDRHIPSLNPSHLRTTTGHNRRTSKLALEKNGIYKKEVLPKEGVTEVSSPSPKKIKQPSLMNPSSRRKTSVGGGVPKPSLVTSHQSPTKVTSNQK